MSKSFSLAICSKVERVCKWSSEQGERDRQRERETERNLAKLEVVEARKRRVSAKSDAARVVQTDKKRAAEQVVADHCELEIFNELSVYRGGDFGHSDEDGKALALLSLMHSEQDLLD
jgi:hypothetical protein